MKFLFEKKKRHKRTSTHLKARGLEIIFREMCGRRKRDWRGDSREVWDMDQKERRTYKF